MVTDKATLSIKFRRSVSLEGARSTGRRHLATYGGIDAMAGDAISRQQ